MTEDLHDDGDGVWTCYWRRAKVPRDELLQPTWHLPSTPRWQQHRMLFFLQCTMATRPNLSGKCGWGRILRSVHHLSTASTGLVGRALIQGRGIGSWGTLPGSLFDKIHIVGDSKIVIDWALSHNFIIMPCLQHWLQNAQNLMASFSNITFEHVFWEQNLCAGALSKHDSIHFDSQVDGSVRGSGTFLF